MTRSGIDLDTMAWRFACSSEPTPDVLAALTETRFVFAGYGSIARPLAEGLAGCGVRTATLADPKRYQPRSTASQCGPDEVGRMKVEVGAERLRALGADVTAYARDLYCVPEGIVDRQTIVIAGLDNRRGDIRANRIAAAAGARLLKINTEPALQTVSVRAYDYRAETTICAECQLAPYHYERQRHPRSCDGPGAGRRTNSPRWLSQLAGHVATLAAWDLVADLSPAPRWYGYQWQYCHEGGTVRGAELCPNPRCRWDHLRRWPNVQRLAEGPDRLQLGDLLHEAYAARTARTRIRFCQQVALRGRCRDGACDLSEPRWLYDWAIPIATCPDCGGPVEAVPFWTFSEVDARRLRPVMELPLSAWGVEPYAIIEVRRADRAVSFVVGHQ